MRANDNPTKQWFDDEKLKKLAEKIDVLTKHIKQQKSGHNKYNASVLIIEARRNEINKINTKVAESGYFSKDEKVAPNNDASALPFIKELADDEINKVLTAIKTQLDAMDNVSKHTFKDKGVNILSDVKLACDDLYANHLQNKNRIQADEIKRIKAEELNRMQLSQTARRKIIVPKSESEKKAEDIKYAQTAEDRFLSNAIAYGVSIEAGNKLFDSNVAPKVKDIFNTHNKKVSETSLSALNQIVANKIKNITDLNDANSNNTLIMDLQSWAREAIAYLNSLSDGHAARSAKNKTQLFIPEPSVKEYIRVIFLNISLMLEDAAKSKDPADLSQVFKYMKQSFYYLQSNSDKINDTEKKDLSPSEIKTLTNDRDQYDKSLKSPQLFTVYDGLKRVSEAAANQWINNPPPPNKTNRK